MLEKTIIGVGGVDATTVHTLYRLITTFREFGLGGGEECGTMEGSK